MLGPSFVNAFGVVGRLRTSVVGCAVAVAVAVGLWGCEDRATESKGRAEPSAVSAVGGEQRSKVVSGLGPHRRPAPTKWHVPVGPKLGIFPGKGVGAIRFGATQKTIERHMNGSCELVAVAGVKRLKRCVYAPQALEFFLQDGVLQRVVVQGRHRLVSRAPRVQYGIFNGGFAEGAQLEMLVAGVQEFLGKPKSVTAAAKGHPHGASEIHRYPGATLEFDRAASGQLKLAGVVLEPLAAAR